MDVRSNYVVTNTVGHGASCKKTTCLSSHSQSSHFDRGERFYSTNECYFVLNLSQNRVVGGRLGGEREGDKGDKMKCSIEKIAYCQGTENPNIKSLDYGVCGRSRS